MTHIFRYGERPPFIPRAYPPTTFDVLESTNEFTSNRSFANKSSDFYTTIVHVMDLKETETEENYVRCLATGLCTVWNNNPAAFKWWSGLVYSIHSYIFI